MTKGTIETSLRFDINEFIKFENGDEFNTVNAIKTFNLLVKRIYIPMEFHLLDRCLLVLKFPAIITQTTIGDGYYTKDDLFSFTFRVCETKDKLNRTKYYFECPFCQKQHRYLYQLPLFDEIACYKCLGINYNSTRSKSKSITKPMQKDILIWHQRYPTLGSLLSNVLINNTEQLLLNYGSRKV